MDSKTAHVAQRIGWLQKYTTGGRSLQIAHDSFIEAFWRRNVTCAWPISITQKALLIVRRKLIGSSVESQHS
jgi:hypothetical protein